METLNVKTQLIEKDILTTSNPFMAAEGDVLKFTTANQIFDKALLLQGVDYGEIGFERKSDWVRLCNKLNRYDYTPIKRIITGDKKSLDYGGLKISRKDIEYSEDGFEVKFDKPVDLVIEEIGDKYITAKVTKLQGKITWEWYRSKAYELKNMANGLEIYIHSIDIIE